MKTLRKSKENTHAKPQNELRSFKDRAEGVLDQNNLDLYWERLSRLVARYGPTASNVSLTAKKMKKPLSGAIDPMTWNIAISVKSDLQFKPGRKLGQFLAKMSINDPFLELLEDVTKHEIGHWELPRGSRTGCPYDNVIYHESFLQPAFEELVKSGKFSEKGAKKWAERVVNAVTDIIDNYNAFRYSKIGGNGGGQVLFWYLNGQEFGQFNEEYTMFVKLNLALWGNKEAGRLLGQFLVNGIDEKGENVGKAVGESVSKLMQIFTQEKILDREAWEEITREYVRELVRYIEESDEPEMPTSMGDRTPNGKGEGEESEGKGQGGGSQEEEQDESEDEGQESGSGQDKDESGEGNEQSSDEEEAQSGDEDEGEEEDEDSSPFGKLSGQDMERIMQERKDKGKGMPFYLDRTTALDALYKSLAKRMIIRPRKGDAPTASYPFVAVRRRKFDPDRDEMHSCDTSNLRFDPITRKLVPTVVTQRHPIDLPIKKDFKDFPAVAFALLDASGTMMGGGDRTLIPWGDKSGYHYASLSFYCLLRQLEHMHILNKVEINGAIFHNETIAARGLEATKKLLLNPTSGGTNIDIDKVRAMLAGKKDALFPFISDGDIHNWDSVKEEFIELAKKQQFFMIMVGGDNQTTRDLKAAGLHVEVVNSYEDVVGLVIDLTRKTYAKSLAEKGEKEAERYTR